MNWEEIIKQLRSNSDTQTNLTKDIDNEIFIRSAKAMEELGEVNQALLKYKNSINVSNSLKHVEITNLDVAEECIDLAICAIDMAMALGMEDQDIIQVFVRKMDKWRNKMISNKIEDGR